MLLLTPFYQTLLDDLNYFSLTILMAIESSVFPLPSEIVVPPAAYMAAEGRMTMPLVVFFATLGSIIGASANYVVSYYVGRPVIYKFVESRVGHMLLLNREKMEAAEKYFDRKGAVATLIGRLLPGVRHLISIPAGLSRMHYGRFVLYTAIGAAIWNVILALLGWYLHSLVPLSQLNEQVKLYERPILYGLVALAGAIVVYLVYHGLRHKKPTDKVE